jgi:hypothetical protein
MSNKLPLHSRGTGAHDVKKVKKIHSSFTVG